MLRDAYSKPCQTVLQDYLTVTASDDTLYDDISYLLLKANVNETWCGYGLTIRVPLLHCYTVADIYVAAGILLNLVITAPIYPLRVRTLCKSVKWRSVVHDLVRCASSADLHRLVFTGG